jgi:hypothetical protein
LLGLLTTFSVFGGLFALLDLESVMPRGGASGARRATSMAKAAVANTTTC